MVLKQHNRLELTVGEKHGLTVFLFETDYGWKHTVDDDNAAFEQLFSFFFLLGADRGDLNTSFFLGLLCSGLISLNFARVS